MSGRGFGKPLQALPVKPKGKRADDKFKSYTLCHFGRDGVFRSLELKAKSEQEAFRKFNVFLDVLELCLAGASDQEILKFMEENPL
jgi:hypothetical protein